MRVIVSLSCRRRAGRFFHGILKTRKVEPLANEGLIVGEILFGLLEFVFEERNPFERVIMTGGRTGIWLIIVGPIVGGVVHCQCVA